MDRDKERVVYYLDATGKWLAQIRDLRMETSMLKDMLSATMRQRQKFDSVEQAEYFQQRFIEKDQVLDLFRQDISILRQSLSTDDISDVFVGKFISLKDDLRKLTGEMQRLRDAFSDFLSTEKGC